MKRALVIWFSVAALVAMGCSPAPGNSDSFGSVGTLQDSWIEIWDWYDLDAVRNNLSGSYVLMTDLDSNTDGYEQLASPTASGGKGWQPIGTRSSAFRGVFDGNGKTISDLFIHRTDTYDGVALFGGTSDGRIENVGLTNVNVTGAMWTAGLVGRNLGPITNSYVTGRVSGGRLVGGLVGENGGAAGGDRAKLDTCYSVASVDGSAQVGGLLGINWGGTVSNSHYNYHEVLINGQNVISVGALSNEDFQEWLANDKTLNVSDRLPQEDGYYLIGDVIGLRQLLAFGQDETLRFRLAGDLDLAEYSGFFVPYLAGEFCGGGHKVANLSFDFDFICHVGLFGYLAPGGAVSEVSVENVSITGYWGAGGLVGFNWRGTVTGCSVDGSVSGNRFVGGLVGWNVRPGTVSSARFVGTVSGSWEVGGLVGDNRGSVTNSLSDGSVTGDHKIGGLVGSNAEWSAAVTNSYSTASVIGGSRVGGLVGELFGEASVRSSYSTGSVTGSSPVGGLVGMRTHGGPVTNSFWDVQASGTEVSDGGMGRSTAEMKDMRTFSDAAWSEGLDTAWDIAAVADETQRDAVHVWNIVDGETYPFLSWEHVPVVQHDLTISSTDGGSVTVPGEGTFTYEDGTVVDLVAVPDTGYGFVNWTGDVGTIVAVNSTTTTITMNDDYSITANFEPVEGGQTQCTATATGTGIACLTTSHGTIENLKAIQPHSLPSVLFPHGMFDFRITDLTPGQTVTLTIEFPSPLPIGTLWWKYDNGRWYGLPNESDNGDHIMVISLTDGGVHDLDDVPGQITDPGGAGNPMTVGWETSAVDRAAVIVPWIAVLVVVIAGKSLLGLLLRNRSRVATHDR